MRENYEIKFFPNEDIFTKKKDKSNEEFVHETIDKFEGESRILKKQKLLIYFGSRRDDSLPGLGVLKVKNTPSHKKFIEDVISHEIEKSKLPDFETFKYLIYLSKNIRECNNKKYKNFTVAHELQHVLQFAKYDGDHQQHTVLFNYFILKRLYLYELPKEHDAIKKAKFINYRMFGKRDVDIFTDEKIIKSGNDSEKSYWENIKSIDADEDYDWESGVAKCWFDNKKSIEKEIKRIKEKKENYELDGKEKIFLDSYENYLKKCK